MDQEKIGKFIAKCRKENNLTQNELGEKLNVTYKAISKWETGRNLPDASLMPKLCQILNISLNELFAGKKLEEKNISKASEKTILNFLKITNKEKTKRKILIIVTSILITVLISFTIKTILVKQGFMYDDDLKYSKMYLKEENVKGDVDINEFGKININFDIGANKYGYAVFKNPKKAFQTLKENYKEGISQIQKEFVHLPLTNFTYKAYKTYGWQVTSGTEKAKKEAIFVTKFLDIYENSFNQK